MAKTKVMRDAAIEAVHAADAAKLASKLIVRCKDGRVLELISYNYRSAKDELSKEDYALCEYAWYVTAHPRDIDQEQVNKLREAGLDDHQILEAAFVAGFFNYTNRWVSTIAPVPNPGHYSHNRNFED